MNRMVDVAGAVPELPNGANPIGFRTRARTGRARAALRVAAVAWLCAASLPAGAQPGGKYEEAPRLPGADLVPAALLTGPLHTVAEPVALDNFVGRFQIDSRYGQFHVLGATLFAVRVHELAAIKALGDVSESAAFQEALGRAVQAPVQLVGSAFTNPTGTVENIATGFGTVLGRVGRVATVGARAVGDAKSDMVAPTAPAPAQPAALAGEELPPAFTGDPFGFNKARREWAKELKIDPYTTNPVLRVRLDEVARATFAGNFAVNMTVGLVVAPLQYATTFDGVVRDSVWNTPVVDLIEQNERKLQAMGIAGRPVRDFFRNRWFTPSVQTALVQAMEQLPHVQGLETIIETATTLQGEARARSLVGAVRLLAGFHRKTALAKVRASGVVLIGTTHPGDLVVATDLDYVWWNEEAAQFAARADLKAKNRTLLLSGKASPRVEKELARAKWSLRAGLRGEAAK